MGATHTHIHMCMGYAGLAEAMEENFSLCALFYSVSASRELPEMPDKVAFLFFPSQFFTAHLCVVHCPHTNLCIALSSVATSFLFSVSLDSLSGQKTQQQQLGVLSINILWQTCCCCFSCCWEQAGRKKKGDFSIKKFRHEITIACNKYLKYRIYQ